MGSGIKLMKNVCIFMSVYGKDCPVALDAALDSICNQTYPNIEIFICKDGQLTEALEDIILKFVRTSIDVTVLSNPENIGLAKSLNKIIDHVLSREHIPDFFARMDSDDIAYPQRIEEQILYMEENRLDVCGSYCREFGATYALDKKMVPTLNNDIVNMAVSRCPFVHPTVVFHAEVFISGVRYPENTVFSEDMALWFILIKEGFSLGNIPKVLLDYRLNEDTVKRRLGVAKGFSEFKLRWKYMISSKQYSFANVTKLCLRLPFHILPVYLVKILYKYAR
ncbi:TPA: glycosyltransferase [Vibrio vulnificus]|nr:glycosyltransferase [Vibrio vulnificus]